MGLFRLYLLDICILYIIFIGFVISVNGSTLPPPTGPTVDMCKDSGDLDCKQLNDSLHLCAKKDSPPAILYCPKFCGICTPSGVMTSPTVTSMSGSTTASGCVDSPDVDCKLANDTQNICALRTIAATKYCPKFCDYCSGMSVYKCVS